MKSNPNKSKLISKFNKFLLIAVNLSMIFGFLQVKSRAGYQVSTFGTSNEIYTTFTGIQLGGSAGMSVQRNWATSFEICINSEDL